MQERLTDLGFFVGPIDGQFGNLTKMAVWAFEKLVMQTPRDEATGVVTDEMWQLMQQPMRDRAASRRTRRVRPPRTTSRCTCPSRWSRSSTTTRPVLISHMSCGTGEEWKEEVTIDVGEYGNEHGAEPLVRGEIGWSITPGGVYDVDRLIEGVRQSALGGMWDPAYFNYGIAIHGAMNVPLEPASHGCIRVPLKVGEIFHDFIGIGDSVFVWDGVKEPEIYGNQPPRFNMIDPDYSTTTTSTTVVTTVPDTDPPRHPGPADPAASDPAAAPPPPPTSAADAAPDDDDHHHHDDGAAGPRHVATAHRLRRRLVRLEPGDDLDGASEDPFEQALALVGGEQLEADLGVGSRHRSDRHRVVLTTHRHRRP